MSPQARLAVWASGGALLLLLLPVQIQGGWDGRAGQAVGGALHVLLFAGLAWLWTRPRTARIPRWLLWLALALVAAGMEWLQTFVGRSAEPADWLYGAAGAACVCASGRLFQRLWVRGALLAAVAVCSPVWELGLWGLERCAFPVLAAPGAGWASRGWNLNAVKLSVGANRQFRVARKAPRRAGQPEPYPGLFRAPVRRDWRGMAAWQTALFWPGSAPAVMAVRIDDRSGNPPYAERFQREFAVTQGWNAVRIPLADIAAALEPAAIRQWGVFLVSAEAFDYFLLDAVRLEPAQEPP